MNYAELIAKATHGRKAAELSREWGVNEMTLGRYLKGKRLPDYTTALIIARAAGVPPGEALEVLAETEQLNKAANFKLQKGFAQISHIALLATIAISCSLYYVKSRRKVRTGTTKCLDIIGV